MSQLVLYRQKKYEFLLRYNQLSAACTVLYEKEMVWVLGRCCSTQLWVIWAQAVVVARTPLRVSRPAPFTVRAINLFFSAPPAK